MGEFRRGPICLFVAAVGLSLVACSSSVNGVPQAVGGTPAATSTAGSTAARSTTSGATPSTIIAIPPEGVAADGYVSCDSLAPVLVELVSGWNQSVLADGLCMWKAPDGIRLVGSAKLSNHPAEALEDMRASGGFTVQDPRLTELGAVAKAGMVMSALSPKVMVTLMLDTNDEAKLLDLAIRIMQSVAN